MRALTSVFVALGLLLSATHAQRGTHPRPGAESGPTPVEVGLYINDVVKVNAAEQLVTADFFLVQRWRDPSLAGGTPRVVSPATVWTPNLVVIDEGRLFRKLPDELDIDAEGNVRSTQRFVGTLTNRLHLAEFPFDKQSFRILVASGNTEEQVELRVAEEITGQRQELTITDWTVRQGQMVNAPYVFAPTGQSFVGMAYEFPAERRMAFYLWKAMLPLCLVVMMAFSVFWVDQGQIGPRMSVAVTSMLTLIAYRFLLGAMLPRLSYLTRMDWYTLGCTALVFLNLATVVATAYLKSTDREAASTRINYLARGLFPTAFVVVFVVSFFL